MELVRKTQLLVLERDGEKFELPIKLRDKVLKKLEPDKIGIEDEEILAGITPKEGRIPDLTPFLKNGTKVFFFYKLGEFEDGGTAVLIDVFEAVERATEKGGEKKERTTVKDDYSILAEEFRKEVEKAVNSLIEKTNSPIGELLRVLITLSHDLNGKGGKK